MPAPPRGGPMQTIETRVRCRPSPARPRAPQMRSMSPAGDSREGFGQHTGADRHDGAGGDVRSVRLPPTLQGLEPCCAFRLTRGRVWSTDTPSKTCL
jgi:hypothetical protein